MTEIIKTTSRNLRKKQTNAENIFWQLVRNRKFENKKFYRQHPIKFEIDNVERFFIADFYCHECKLVLEIDGKIHDQQKDYDELRTIIIEKLSIKVIRFTNYEVENDIEKVITDLKKILLENKSRTVPIFPHLSFQERGRG